MDSAQQQALVQRLVANPQDQAAITEAHAAGQADPESYALLLEQVGQQTTEPTMAGHWLNEAANVWITTFNDLHRAATVLMAAVERFPEAEAPAQRLAQLYEESGDQRAKAALFDRRATALAAKGKSQPEQAAVAARLFETLGQLWSEEGLDDAQQARSAFSRAIEAEPQSQFAIYSLRESWKAEGEFSKALPYFAMEQALVIDAERRQALLLDEAEVARQAEQPDVAIAALRKARRADAEDPGLKQQLATAILEKYRDGLEPSEAQRGEAAQLFVELAETYPGEHGLSYSMCASELSRSHDRAIQLAMFYAEQLGRSGEVAQLAAGYLKEKPQGPLADEARSVAGGAEPLPEPVPGANSSAAPVQQQAPVEEEVLQQPSPAAPARVQAGAPVAAAAPRQVSPIPTDGSPLSEDQLASLLDEAASFAKKSRKNQAIAAYKKVLAEDPTNIDAVAYMVQQLPPKRKYAELRDILLKAAADDEVEEGQRLEWLREAAGLCERQLRDFDTAAVCWKRILELTPEDDDARDQYVRLLERARRWDELAELLEIQASSTEDLEVRISLERNLARLHSSKRKDLASAGDAWARISALTPSDETALMEAVKLYEQADRLDQVMEVIAVGVAELDDEEAQRELYLKLGSLREGEADFVGAGEALSEGAAKLEDLEMWREAEQHFAKGESWALAANACVAQTELTEDEERQAGDCARAAGYLFQLGKEEEGLSRLEQAVELAPAHEEYANDLEQRLVAADRVGELSALFLGRAEKLEDAHLRRELRRRAAKVQREHLGDTEAARSSYVLVLDDGEDRESLAWLADDAADTRQFVEAADYLARLAKTIDDRSEKLETLHREARLHADELQDVDKALGRYEHILAELDPSNEPALTAMADLEALRDNYEEAAEVLERHLKVAEARDVRLGVATRLADIYEHKLEQAKDAMRLLALVHAEDPDDFDATQRLCDLARTRGDWKLVAELTVELIAIEGDDDEVSAMTRELAQIFTDKLDEPGKAFDVLAGVADSGDEPCREEYMTLGDRIDRKGDVAARIVRWYEDAAHGPDRVDALHSAFGRFTEAGRGAQAAAVAKDLASTRSLEPATANTLEDIGKELKDLEALSLAHSLKVAELEGGELGEEKVRQAEVLTEVGVSTKEALAHAESSLNEVAPDDVEPLLERLAKIAGSGEARIDLYERQVSRCEGSADRLNALCRAAEVASEEEEFERAGEFFEVALSGGVHEEALERIIDVAREADEKNKDTALRNVLAMALAGGGQGARDGGKTRSRLLRRAAVLAHDELDELERALGWIGDALVCHVDDAGLKCLLDLAEAASDFGKAEAVLERCLAEVFDGPMVRRLLLCRADLRQEQLGDRKGAAKDLKRLHDLAPADLPVAERLAKLYEDVGDFRGIVQLYENQILRGRDKDLRAELAHRVALIWQDTLKDPREAADAWRRVLRLRPADPEAKAGLASAKEGMLKAKRSAATVDSGDKAGTEAATALPSPAEEEAPDGASGSVEDKPEADSVGHDAKASPTEVETDKEPAELSDDSTASGDEEAGRGDAAASSEEEAKEEDEELLESISPDSVEFAEDEAAPVEKQGRKRKRPATKAPPRRPPPVPRG